MVITLPLSAAAYEMTAAQRDRFAALSAAREHGLDPANYHIERLEALAAKLPGEDGHSFSDSLAGSIAAFARDLAYGRVDPAVADPDWHIAAPVRRDGPGLAPPSHAGYRRLHEATRRYLAIERDGGWQPLPPGPALSVGLRHQQVELARNRLRLTGDFMGDTQADAWLFGARLDAAVRRFQARVGLPVDGVVGATTRDALNVPVEARLRQLAIALERWRWLPQDLGDEYVWANIPALTLEVIRQGQPTLSLRTIVGHSSRPTPSLASEIRRLVFNPSWSVPTIIATEDMLPRLRRDPGYLERNGFRVYAGWGPDAPLVDPAGIDWAAVSADRLPWRFVQMPGPNNSLGRIKVVFDNDLDIFVHDTPSKGLFSLRTRMFSSGCVRLENASAFANFLLANYHDPGSTTAADWLRDPRTRAVELNRRLPIYLVYMTSWVDRQGRVNFRRDLYRRDEAVASALGW